MTPREDDASATPPHGDPLRDGAGEQGSAATRHGVQLDPRGEPEDAASRATDDTGRPVPDEERRP
jgi:hypothetical protein